MMSCLHAVRYTDRHIVWSNPLNQRRVDHTLPRRYVIHFPYIPLASYQAGMTEIIELNVGGRKFTTTRATLCSDGDSMLAAMFSGDLEPAQLDRKGRYFLDRNGDWFAYILSYLRGEPLQLLPVNQRRALAAEARFYQVYPSDMLYTVFAQHIGFAVHL